MVGRNEQTLLIALAVNVDEQRLQGTKEGGSRGLIVDKDATPTRTGDFASDNYFIFAGIDSRFIEEVDKRGISFHLEDTLDRSAVGTRTDQILRRPAPEKQFDSVDYDRFPRSGLSSQDIETGLEFNFETID